MAGLRDPYSVRSETKDGLGFYDGGSYPPAAPLYLQLALINLGRAWLADVNEVGSDTRPKVAARETFMRDQNLALVVVMVAERWSLKPTRNTESPEHSACDAVALATNLGEKTVEKVIPCNTAPLRPPRRPNGFSKTIGCILSNTAPTISVQNGMGGAFLMATDYADRTAGSGANGRAFPLHHLRQMMRAGTFPLPLKIGAKAVRWRMSEIEEWVNSHERATGNS